MFEWRDLFQWDRFITPSIIKVFYWLAIVLVALYGLSGIFSGLAAMALNPFAGFVLVLASLIGIVVGVVFSRVAAEFILIVLFPPILRLAVHGEVRGTTTSLVRPAAGQPPVLATPSCAAIFVPSQVARNVPATATEFLAAAISAVALLPEGVPGAFVQTALGESGS